MGFFPSGYKEKLCPNQVFNQWNRLLRKVMWTEPHAADPAMSRRLEWNLLKSFLSWIILCSCDSYWAYPLRGFLSSLWLYRDKIHNLPPPHQVCQNVLLQWCVLCLPNWHTATHYFSVLNIGRGIRDEIIAVKCLWTERTGLEGLTCPYKGLLVPVYPSVLCQHCAWASFTFPLCTLNTAGFVSSWLFAGLNKEFF